MKGIIKPNMTLLETDKPMLSPFGLHTFLDSQAFAQGTGYRPIALDFLQDKQPLLPPRPPALHLDVNLNVVLESLKKEREKREKQQKKVNERILERVYLLERQIEHTGMRLPRLTIQFGQTGDWMSDARPNAAVTIVPDAHTVRAGLRVKPAVFPYPEWSGQRGARIPWAMPILTQAIGEMVTAAVQNTWIAAAPTEEIWKTNEPSRQPLQPREIRSGTQTWAAVVRQAAAQTGGLPIKNQTAFAHEIGLTTGARGVLADWVHNRRGQQPVVLHKPVRHTIQTAQRERDREQASERQKARQVVRQIAQVVALTLQHRQPHKSASEPPSIVSASSMTAKRSGHINGQLAAHPSRVQNTPLTYLPLRTETAEHTAPTTPSHTAQATSGHALPEWGTRFLDLTAQSSNKRGFMQAQTAKTGQIEWTAPQAVRRPAHMVYREDRETQRTAPPPMLSEGELRRTADKVYRMIQERLRRELRRSGR